MRISNLGIFGILLSTAAGVVVPNTGNAAAAAPAPPAGGSTPLAYLRLTFKSKTPNQEIINFKATIVKQNPKIKDVKISQKTVTVAASEQLIEALRDEGGWCDKWEQSKKPPQIFREDRVDATGKKFGP
jgi:hypothetical protein